MAIAVLVVNRDAALKEFGKRGRVEWFADAGGVERFHLIEQEAAIAIANDSPYGLAGNVVSGSLERSLAVARRLRAGFIGVNGGTPYAADTPFGGYKASGIGRQNGVAGFDQYTEIKSVAYPAQ